MTIDYNPELNKNTLIFLLKPTCTPCKQNLLRWISLYKQIDSSRTRILPISIDNLENTITYSVNNNIPFPIFFTLAEDFLLSYKAFLTPQTILIDGAEKVLKNWKGILKEDSISEILKKINY